MIEHADRDGKGFVTAEELSSGGLYFRKHSDVPVQSIAGLLCAHGGRSTPGAPSPGSVLQACGVSPALSSCRGAPGSASMTQSVQQSTVRQQHQQLSMHHLLDGADWIRAKVSTRANIHLFPPPEPNVASSWSVASFSLPACTDGQIVSARRNFPCRNGAPLQLQIHKGLPRLWRWCQLRGGGDMQLGL